MSYLDTMIACPVLPLRTVGPGEALVQSAHGGCHDKESRRDGEAELAEYHWQHRDDELGEQVDFEVAKPLRVTMSFRSDTDDPPPPHAAISLTRELPQQAERELGSV